MQMSLTAVVLTAPTSPEPAIHSTSATSMPNLSWRYGYPACMLLAQRLSLYVSTSHIELVTRHLESRVQDTL
jgi:hypothetical protein